MLLRPSSSSTRRAATCPARCWCRRRCRTASCWRPWLVAAAGHAGADPRRPSGARRCACSTWCVRNARAGLRPGVAAPAPAVAGDPARPAGPAGPGGGAAPHRVLRHLEHPGLGHRGLDGGVRGRACPGSPTTGSSGSRGVGGAPDDFASMREVVGRRYRRLLEEGKELPDLVLDRRRQGAARGGGGRPGRAGAGRPAGGQPGQAGGADLPARPRGARRPAPRVAACCSSCSACATRPTASPSGYPPQDALEADAPLGAGRHPRGRARPSGGSSCRASARCAGVRGASEAELAAAVGKATAAKVRRHFDRGAA